ncbi:DUF6316 family protein [Alkalimarinus coralli]|uniref:DUF6316 family protein n=1 Tax=Alkalimarinus coralli TaxID=2935863 RepID=UPI00202B3D18|nr:DUF6316 family protein [Alkalimarinus coralli]
MAVRSGEKIKTWFRSDRFLCVNEKWFFITRELTQEGPFDSRGEAELELNLYIRHVNDGWYMQAQPG